MSYTEGDRIVFTKRGESRTYDTEWPGVYLKRTATGRHSIRLDGQKRSKSVRDSNLRREALLMADNVDDPGSGDGQ